jgi:TRAP-type C4-dicarboxylate transport system permease small subunit
MAPGSDGEEAAFASSPPARAALVLARLSGALSTLLIVFVLGVVIYAIVQRYLFDSPLLWGDEFIGYVLVAIVMLGVAEALRRGDHISIDLLTAKAGPRVQRVLAVWSNLAVMAFAVVLGWSTWEGIVFAYDFGSYSAGYIEIATWIPQVPIVIGCLLLGLVAAIRICATFSGPTAK